MTTSNKPTVIGLAGTFASGKDTLAHYLVEKCGYSHFSTGDMVRKEALKQYGSAERPVCQRIARELREKDGAGIFVQKALRAYDEQKLKGGIVVTGLRTTGEAKEIQKTRGVIVFVDAPVEIRYERMKSRQRDDETQLTLEEFKELEAKEWYAGNKDTDFNFSALKQMANIVLENDANLESFIEHANKEIFA